MILEFVIIKRGNQDWTQAFRITFFKNAFEFGNGFKKALDILKIEGFLIEFAKFCLHFFSHNVCIRPHISGIQVKLHRATGNAPRVRSGRRFRHCTVRLVPHSIYMVVILE